VEKIKMQQKHKTIKLSETLFNNLKQYANDSGFENIDEFANFVLEEVIRRGSRGEKKLTDDEEKEVSKNLEELGYLNE